MIKIDKFNNIEIIRGDTAIIDLELENHKIVNGDTVHFSIKHNKYDSEAILNKQFEKINNNTLKLFLTKEDTKLEPGTYDYDIECRLDCELIDTIFLGKFKVIGDVTNA